METPEHNDSRFTEEGSMIIFPMANCRVHVSWKDKFAGLTIPEARRKMKRFQSKRAQNEMIHYLKVKGIIKNHK
jgi:hypothetical protein